MNQHNEQIVPVDFEAAPVPAADPVTASPAAPGRPPWLWPALGGMALLALLVVFWLPGMVSPPEQPPAPAPDSAPGAAAPRTGGQPGAVQSIPAPEASPWNEAQLARLRKAAQAVLEPLLEIQFDLQERGVEQWAPQAFASATTLAQTGDAQYKAREFEAARDSYQQALDQLQALQLALPEAVAGQLEAADAALEALDPARAAAAVTLLELMEPENPALPGLAGRLEGLPALQALLDQAASAEAAGDLAGAVQALDEAVARDPAHRRSAGELARVRTAHLVQRFNLAMSSGYQALDEGRLGPARQAFTEAGTLVPGSAEAASALQEVAVAETNATLARLQRSGRAHEADEQWQQAVAAYEQALRVDPNLSFARQGLARAGRRAELDRQLRAVLDEPGRLADLAVAQDSAELLTRAAAIDPRGPLLARQLAELGALLEKANTPIRVTLRSDGETEVIVYKVARLGRFDQRVLELRPGTYVAVGSRNGYRDVRREFTLSHDQPATPVTVRCTEPI